MPIIGPKLRISFSAVAGATNYTICYQPMGSTNQLVCITATSSPVEITTGIECGVDYEGYIQSNCPGGQQSAQVFFTSDGLDCPPATGFCYNLSIYPEVVNGNFYVHFIDPVEGQISVPYNQIATQAMNNYYETSLCSEVPPGFTSGGPQGTPYVLSNGSSVTGGTVSCVDAGDCRPAGSCVCFDATTGLSYTVPSGTAQCSNGQPPICE